MRPIAIRIIRSSNGKTHNLGVASLYAQTAHDTDYANGFPVNKDQELKVMPVGDDKEHTHMVDIDMIVIPINRQRIGHVAKSRNYHLCSFL